MTAPRQLPLTLPHHAAFGRDDFLVGAANATALALVDGWPQWPSRPVFLYGPAGTGKSHLVEIWRRASGAELINGADLAVRDLEALVAAGAIALEDVHEAPIEEAALFHLLNLAGERQAAVLMTSRVQQADLPVALPDLASRLRAALPVELSEPDDDLLRRVLTKLFADRQLSVDKAVIEYLLTRMERSLGAARFIVEQLDTEALSRQRPVTVRFAAEILAPMLGGQADFWPEEP